MQLKRKNYVIVFFGVIALIGLWFFLESPIWGLSAASDYVRTQAGGSMDASQFNSLTQSYQSAYRWLGTVLLGVGGSFFLSALWKLVHD